MVKTKGKKMKRTKLTAENAYYEYEQIANKPEIFQDKILNKPGEDLEEIIDAHLDFLEAAMDGKIEYQRIDRSQLYF